MTAQEERYLELGKAIERAAAELPEGWDLEIHLEKGAGTIRLYLPDDDAFEDEFNGDTMGEQINNAISFAIEKNQTREDNA